MTPILEIRNLTVSIGGKLVCRDLSLSITPNQRWGILGINGIGKTSLLHTLAGLREPDAGEILLNGKTLAQLSRREVALIAGLLLQDSEDYFSATLLETALIGRHPHLPGWQWETDADRDIALATLAAVGLKEMAQRLSHTLSGGERRRLAIATLLTQNPQLYMLDEPTNHLDLHHQIAMLDLLSGQAQHHDKTLLMILHDVNLAARYCDSLLLLFGNGESLSGETGELLNEANLSRLYQHPITAITNSNTTVYVPA